MDKRKLNCIVFARWHLLLLDRFFLERKKKGFMRRPVDTQTMMMDGCSETYTRTHALRTHALKDETVLFK